MSEKRTLHNIIRNGGGDVLHSGIAQMKEKEEYEYEDLRVCEKGLQRASCSKCLFEVLCHYEKNFKSKQE